MAERQGCIIHSAGMVLEGQGLLFVGHSGAGKSTISNLLLPYSGHLLCDDRNIICRKDEGWRMYGTWFHSDISEASSGFAPLRAIVFLEQAPETRLIPMEDRREIVRRLPFFIVKPLATSDWWEKTLQLTGQIAREIPVYRLRFTKSDHVIEVLKPLVSEW